MLGLSAHRQAWFVGVRSTFYRLAMITGQGLLVMLAGFIAERSGDVRYGWVITFYVLAGAFGLFCLYHAWVLPRPAASESRALELDAPAAIETMNRFAAQPGPLDALAAAYRESGPPRGEIVVVIDPAAPDEADPDAIEAALEKLTEASAAIAQKLYAEQAQATGGEPPEDAADAAPEDVVDAEFEEVKDDK